jgi:hypothetical protein
MANCKALYFGDISVQDPDTGNMVELYLFKHENGGIFAVDASYCDCHDDNIQDPLNDNGLVNTSGTHETAEQD